MHLRGRGVKGGENQEAADHQENDAAGGKAHAAEGDDPVPLIGGQRKALRHVPAPGFPEEGETCSRHGKTNETDEPLAERLAHEPGRLVLRRLVLAAAGATAEGKVQGGDGKTGIDKAADQMRGSDAQALHVGTSTVGIGQRFQNAPGAEAE
jgi:hypothetical protein